MAALLLAVGWGAVVAGQARDIPASECTLEFTFIARFSDIPFFGPVKQGVADMAEQIEERCEIKGPAGGDAEAQIGRIRQAVDRSYYPAVQVA
jgi:ABC-type sugar transport system substrate-binding protein